MHNNNTPPPAFYAGLEPFGRRRFLRYGILAGSALLAGCARLLGRDDPQLDAVAPATAAEVSQPEVAGADQSLRPDERAVFEKLIRVVMPVEEAGYLDTQTIPVMDNIDAMVRAMPPFVRDRMNLAITAFDTGSILLSFKFRRFSSLDDAEALAYVNAWHEGTFIQRGAITSLKVLVCVNYWRDQRAAARIDYDGPVTVKWGVPRLGNQPLPRV
ncbi:MAG: transcriptional initiation protein Tat [Pseudomonadota bacterium]